MTLSLDPVALVRLLHATQAAISAAVNTTQEPEMTIANPFLRDNTPWEIEEDLDHTEITDRRRKSQAIAADDSDFIDNVQYLRSVGEDDAMIMRRLGVDYDVWETRLRRAGLPSSMPKPMDRHVIAALEKLIAAGQRFSSTSLPIPETEGFSGRLLTSAISRGRIRQVSRTKFGDQYVMVYDVVPDA